MDQDLKKHRQENARGGKRLQAAESESRASDKVRATAAATKENVQKNGMAVRRAAAAKRAAEEQQEDQNLMQILRGKAERVRRRWRQILREKHRHNFPESDRFLIQVVLLTWSMVPMLASLLQEHTWGRRRQALRKAATGISKFEARRRRNPVVFMLAGCLALGLMVFLSMYTMGTTVTYDGEVIAVVSSEEEVEQARSHLEQVTTKTLGKRFTVDASLLQYSTGLMKRQEIVDDEQTLEEDLFGEVGLVTKAYCLYVEGARIGATPYEGALEELLEQLKAAATTEDTISCEFEEFVEIREEIVPTEDIMNLGYIAEVLYSTKTEEVTYEVKKGDTWTKIASNHDLTNDELLALNPGYNINKLQIGEVLTLSASVPYLTMTVTQQERYVDQVQYDIEYTDDSSMYQGDYKVTSPGQFGMADVVANVTYVNGTETERTLLSSVTLKEPVTEHRLQGTKERPTWYPTGSFRWPTSGRVTSYFGGRKSPGGIGSTNHKGLDIAAPRGTPIYAADGGTVVYSGWMGGYGYTVRIRHDGTGYETFYAHNSSLLVKSGQHVYKGQQIAKMGSTGNSTGSHCHFEIRYNGVPKNPLNFI